MVHNKIKVVSILKYTNTKKVSIPVLLKINILSKKWCNVVQRKKCADAKVQATSWVLIWDKARRN